MKLAIGTVRTDSSTVRIATSSTTWGSATHSCTACSTAVWKAKLWKAMKTDTFKTVWITNITAVSGFDSVTRFALLRSYTTGSCATVRIHVICWRTVSYSLTNDRDLVGWILEAERSSDTGLSARVSNVSQPSALGIGAATFITAASKHRGTVGGFPTAGAVLEASKSPRPSQSMRSRLLTAVSSSWYSRCVVFII